MAIRRIADYRWEDVMFFFVVSNRRLPDESMDFAALKRSFVQ